MLQPASASNRPIYLGRSDNYCIYRLRILQYLNVAKMATCNYIT